MNKLFLAGAALLGTLTATPAAAAELLGDGCMTDLSFSGSSSLASCYGRYDKNKLNNASNSEINTALTALGYAGPAITYSSIEANTPGNVLSPLAGDAMNAPVNFPGVLNGTLFVGIHSGGGGANGVGNSTTFYKISAVDLDAFTFKPQGASTATLFAIVQSAVPEPATWALMILGFGVIGASLRRRENADRVRVSYS